MNDSINLKASSPEEANQTDQKIFNDLQYLLRLTESVFRKSKELNLTLFELKKRNSSIQDKVLAVEESIQSLLQVLLEESCHLNEVLIKSNTKGDLKK